MKKLLAHSIYLAIAATLFTQCQTKNNGAVANQDGAQLFDHYCARCHLSTGIGGPAPGNSINAPDIRQFTKSKIELEEIIKNGFGKMPPFGDSISAEGRSMIAAYVETQIEKNGRAASN